MKMLKGNIFNIFKSCNKFLVSLVVPIKFDKIKRNTARMQK